MTFDTTKPVQTRDGRKARIICVDRKSHNRPIVALISDADGVERSAYFTADGQWNSREQGSTDLVNISEETSRWVNFYAGAGYETREIANQNNNRNLQRVAILQVKIEGDHVKDVIVHDI